MLKLLLLIKFKEFFKGLFNNKNKKFKSMKVLKELFHKKVKTIIV